MNSNPDAQIEDPHLQNIRRKLVRLMLGSILITFVLVGLVLAAVIYKVMTPTEQAANIEQFPKSVQRFSDKNCGTNKELEQMSDSIESHSALNTSIEQQIHLNLDSHIISYSLSGDILALQSRDGKGEDEFILYNHRLRQIISRLKITSPKS